MKEIDITNDCILSLQDNYITFKDVNHYQKYGALPIDEYKTLFFAPGMREIYFNVIKKAMDEQKNIHINYHDNVIHYVRIDRSGLPSENCSPDSFGNVYTKN